MTRTPREKSGAADAMNFVVTMCKILYRCIARNKLITVLVTAASVAAVMVYMSTSRETEEVLHQDLGNLKGHMRDMANSLHTLQKQVSELGSHEHKQGTELTYWLSAKDESKMRHVIQVFERIGYKRGDSSSDWRVLWSFEYPFSTLRSKLQHLKPHQKINHFPGNGVFTSKVELARSLAADFHPVSFVLPKEADRFKDVVKAHPERLWVVKNSKHRGIKVLRAEEVPLDLSNSFVQEFIPKPFLIGGRKFDIGMYVAITGVAPLRVFTYEEEFLLRFCGLPYHPFDRSEVRKYVVTEDYTLPWEVPVLSDKYSKFKLSRREVFLTFMKEHGYQHETERIMREMKTIIRTVMQKYEPSLVKSLQGFGDPKHFFELVRFDFILDDSLKVWLMEINMSPNMDSSHFHENSLMYEQVLFNTFALMGLTRPGGTDLAFNGDFESVMVVSEHDLQLPLPECYNGFCNNCTASVCRLCKACQSTKDSFILKQAFLEHVGRRNFARVVPEPINDPSSLVSVEAPSDASLSAANRLLTQWYRGKCRQHITWCT